ncbi:MAG: 4-alpha-glucanotransferase, partial [Cyanobacteria bacterium P01_H01_bin.121]
MGLYRASGVLLHPTCLPSAHGIGDLGKGAYDFIDFLAASGQKLWQILPLGPTGYEHSPYTMNFSAFAGNPLLISLEKLVEAGLLTADNVEPIAASNQAKPERVSFSEVIPHKTRLFELAYQNFRRGQEFNPNSAFDEFCAHQAWLDDYALFMAIHESNPGKTWNQWDAPIARRYPEALTYQRQALADRSLYYKFLQFQFFEQWQQLRTHASESGIQII